MSNGAPNSSSSPLVWRIVAWLVLGILTIAAALLVPRHEPWFDEAQAWLLARDASPWDVVWKYARYEGSPSLWHLLLTLPAGVGAPPMALNIVSSALALSGAALLLFCSPLPRVLRVLLPAGFFFFYQYGIVARSYALMMPLLRVVGVLYAARFTHPWRYVLALILVSNVSLHGALIAGVLMTVFVGEAWWRERWTLGRLGPLVLAFAGDTAFIAAQLWPPADLVAAKWVASYDRTWQVVHDMWLACVLPWPVAAALVLLVACCFFYTRGVLLSYLGTTGAVMALFAFRFFNVWHQGILFALLVLHAWMAWSSPVRRRLGRVPEEYWPRLATGALTVTALVHVWWAGMASWNDWRYPYSGTLATARYLREHGIDRERINVFRHSTSGVLLYLDRNPFANVAPYMPGRFWVWTKKVYEGQWPQRVADGEPPWILVGAQMTADEEAQVGSGLPIPGYVVESVFPGHMFWKDRFSMTDSYFLYRRVAPPSGS